MNKPIIFIVGPTGCGKTEVSLRLAQRMKGEIICTDSRTVYKGLDIGTAKPTPEEQATVRHWGLDLVEPSESFSAHQFKMMAQEAIADIQARGKMPLVVGGTGLYIDTLLYDMELGPKADTELRQELETLDIEGLQARLAALGLPVPQNSLNKRHLVRAIELQGIAPTKKDKLEQAIVVGIAIYKEELLPRLRLRAEAMFADPRLYQETETAAARWGWGTPGLSGNIYQVLRLMQEEGLSKQEAIERFVTLDWQLAKRQLTWFRRSADIVWLQRDDVFAYVTNIVDF